jgi:hypothetical protein
MLVALTSHSALLAHNNVIDVFCKIYILQQLHFTATKRTRLEFLSSHLLHAPVYHWLAISIQTNGKTTLIACGDANVLHASFFINVNSLFVRVIKHINIMLCIFRIFVTATCKQAAQDN